MQVGFRRSEVKKRQLLVNNKAILIKGACRHEHDERRGKAVTEAGMMKDIQVLKQLNFNAVRCSHYPNCIRWCALSRFWDFVCLFVCVFPYFPFFGSEPCQAGQCCKQFEWDWKHPP